MPLTGSQLASAVAEKSTAVTTADAAVLAAQVASTQAHADLVDVEGKLATLVAAAPFYVAADDGKIRLYEASTKVPGYVSIVVANGDSVSLPDPEVTPEA